MRVPPLALLVVLLGSLLTATPAAALDKGLQDDGMLHAADPTVRAAFWRDVRSARVRTVRTLVRWDTRTRAIDPVTSAVLRTAGEDARRSGARLMVGIYSPIARSKPASWRLSATGARRYRTFMRSLAASLREGDVPLAAVMTFNEPNFRSMWPQRRARDWVRLSNSGYAAIKAELPDVPVLVGETSSQASAGGGSTMPGLFLRRALCVDQRGRSLTATAGCRTRLRADGFAVHAYDFLRPDPRTPVADPDEWTIGNLAAVGRQLRMLARAGRITPAAARNLHVTEYALRTSGARDVPRAAAARYLRSAWAAARRAGVRTFVWYQLRDPAGDHRWMSGLRGAGGTARPAWDAFRGLR
ncbi:hypothetical protein PAI11_38970 [Patulibacter medicamentivorans]|uniref:Glycoside hydrolase family 5 domain-containing protein n=1 Tax=Patulibacter medicamentivorans TaxID=1097667 RepID=H0EAM3_9ACTN|nr:hypothetical protein [Patulibacter medicamentivorans]EHN09257.1 hypothetical protein PAI11_38970 [Patulibacter medicamentivorans]